jgi:hypothetical protein
MAKETILNRGGSSAIDCILPFAWNCAIGVSTQYFEIFMAKTSNRKSLPKRLMQFGFAYAPPLINLEGPGTEFFTELVENIIPMSYGAAEARANTERGDTFSFNEIKSWLEEAGFKHARTLEAPGPSPLVLATKS